MAAEGRVASLQRSGGGVPKTAVREARVTQLGLEGDRQAHPGIHGGPERALCLFSLERIAALQEEGHPIAPGSTGENVTVAGIDWELFVPGSRWRLGPKVVIEVTRYTTPCKTIAGSFAGRDFNRIHHAQHPGWSRVYARVLQEGVVRAGDPVVPVPAGDA